MNLLLTCGGTAGHINPAIAIAKSIQARRPDTKILFVGAQVGMEHKLIPQEGYELKTVTISNFQRSFSKKAILYNIRTLKRLYQSRMEAKAIIKTFQPDLVVGTGGYASFPIVRAAARRGIPTAIHESNAIPGLTTKVLSKIVDVVMTGFSEGKENYAHPEKVVVTGTPVRPDFFRYTRREARAMLGIEDDRPLLLSYWGSLGADAMNRTMIDFIAMEYQHGVPFRHIHGAARNFENMKKTLSERGIDLNQHPGIELRDYIDNMPTVMAAADLVFCRAGASTISELTALCKPSVLVPSPNVTADHQTKNAKVLADRGGAILLPENECSPSAFWKLAEELLQNRNQLVDMSNAMSGLGSADAEEKIYQTLTALL